MREAAAFRAWLERKQISLRTLTGRDVREWVAELVEGGYTPATIGTKISAVRRLLDAAVEGGVLPSNPAAGVQGPAEHRECGAAAQRTLSLTEVSALFDAMTGKPVLLERNRAMLALLIGHGLRSVEIERINLAHVDLVNRQLRVHGKTRERTVYLRADIASRVEAVFARRTAEGAGPMDPLFVGFAGYECAGQRLQRRGIRFIVDRTYAAAGLLPHGGKRAARASGLKVPTTHSLRATHVTLAIAAGAEIEHVASAVGHADIRTTMRYLDLQNRREHNPALRLAVEF